MSISYKYTPLNESSTEIRLLTIQPGPWRVDIPCTLHHDFLEEGLVYEALSYTWGDLTITRPIILNGTSFEITANLEIALRYLRLTDEKRILWVDATCIYLDRSRMNYLKSVTLIPQLFKVFHSTYLVSGNNGIVSVSIQPTNILAAWVLYLAQPVLLRKPTYTGFDEGAAQHSMILIGLIKQGGV